MRVIDSVKLHTLLFCYTFSFYIFILPASMVIVVPLFIYICTSKYYLNCFFKVWGNPYILRCFLFQLFLTSVACLFPVIYMTLDFSLIVILITQIMHFISATFFFAFLDYHKISFNTLCNAFINIFVIQTLIQCIAFLNPNTIGAFVRIFNKFDPTALSGIGSNVRGFALSAATTYHLSLIYGVAFIIYIKKLIEEKITIKKILIGLLIFIGIFFAGRTGFVGVGIAGLYFLLSNIISVKKKLKAIIKVSGVVAILISIFMLTAPDSTKGLVINNLLPYAFEAIYSKIESGKTQTASTNQLKQMWKRDFNHNELIYGSGNYMDSTGKHYYMRVDPGVLRHLLYGGIIFYSLLILYQLFLTFPFVKRKDYYIFILCMLYYFIMDFKGVTIALNKFAFVSSLMFGYSYIKNYPEVKNGK